MNIKTLEICSLMPATTMLLRWWECTHQHPIKSYWKGRNEYYCKDCGVDLLPTENTGIRKQATMAMKIKYTNLKLRSNFNIKRRDTFICWNCYQPYRNPSKNALTNSKYCKKCKSLMHNFHREQKHYDVVAVNDLGMQGFIENTHRSDLIANGAVFTEGFNQDDTLYSGLGRYTNGSPKTNNFWKEREQITKAYRDINKYGGDYLKQPSKSNTESNITGAEYIDGVLGFFEEEIAIEFNNGKDDEEYYYD